MIRSLFLVLSLPGAALAQAGADKPSDQIFSLESGVVCAPEVVGELFAPDTVAGFTNTILEEPPFVSTDNRVPAVLGIGFGVKAMSHDIAGIDNVTMTISHPPMGELGAIRQSFPTRISGTEPSLTFYQFDFGYELLPGIWTLEATAGGAVIYRSTFEVVRPEQIPELAKVCGFEDLLS